MSERRTIHCSVPMWAGFDFPASDPQDIKLLLADTARKTYSGLLAHEEIHEPHNRDAFLSQHRVYQDGLQSSDGPDDTTFCIRLAISGSHSGENASNPWHSSDNEDHISIKLSKSPRSLLIFRARSKVSKQNSLMVLSLWLTSSSWKEIVGYGQLMPK